MGAATVYLGQFTWENANKIAGRLDDAGIGWWYKQSGGIARIFFAGEWGVRLFVEKDRLDEARRVTREVLRPAGSEPPEDQPE